MQHLNQKGGQKNNTSKTKRISSKSRIFTPLEVKLREKYEQMSLFWKTKIILMSEFNTSW